MKMLSILFLAVALDGVRDRAAEDLLQDALALAKGSKKEVFLTFGTPGCGWCVKFEAWKHKPEVARILEEEFVLVHVDLTRTPGGSALYEKYPRARSAGVPWFVIHDADGKELADSMGPNGNIGCPDTAGEIDVFLGILRRMCRSLKEEDLSALQRSLLDRRKK
jgi:thioredoxin-related protein